MSNMQPKEHPVKYPAKEKAYVFLPRDGAPYRSAVVGITYPSQEYSIFVDAEKSRAEILEYVVSGEGEIWVGGRWLPVKAGDVYILRSGERKEYRSSKKNPFEKIWINYEAEYFSSMADAYRVKSGVYACPEARRVFENALSMAKANLPYSEACQTVAECVHKILRLCNDSLGNELHSEAYRIREALHSAVFKHFDLNDLAMQLHISKSNLIRIYKQCWGTTPYEDLLSAKIEAAKALLVNTQMSSKEIAEKLCFANAHYFSSVFCERVGVRPTVFRRRGREEK